MLSTAEVLELQRIVRQVPVTDHVVDYALALVRQTRVGEAGRARLRRGMASLGGRAAGRAVPSVGGQGPGLLHGRTYVSTDDIAALAPPVLRHRIVTNFAAESEGVTPDRVIERLLATTPSKEGELTSDPRLTKIFAA